MISRTIVIAPDSFKGTAEAAEVAKAIGEGWSSVRGGDRIRLLPMADGGEGTIDAFEAAVPGTVRMPVRVVGPVAAVDAAAVDATAQTLAGRAIDGASDRQAQKGAVEDGGTEDGAPRDGLVDASWLLLPDGTGVVELAATSGITLLDPLAPFEAHTYGFGQAIAAALDHGVDRLLLAIGGSASTDGGAGMLQALGASLTGAGGGIDGSRTLFLGNAALADVEAADLRGLRPLPAGGAVVLSDVTNPLLGETGAAAVFGPQKGASQADVEVLDRNLAWFAAVIASAERADARGEASLDESAGRRGRRDAATQVDVIVDDVEPASPRSPGAGAAGGAGFGLLAWGARVESGAVGVGEAIGLPAAAKAADIVITGEGRYDAQTSAGKVASYVAGIEGSRVVLIAGSIEASPDGVFERAISLTELAGGVEAAMAEPLVHLRAAGAALAGAVRG